MSTSVVKWCKGLNKGVSIIKRRYRDQTQVAAYMADSFITFFRTILVLLCTTPHMLVFLLNFVQVSLMYAPGGSVGIATELRAGRSGIESR